MRQASVLVGAAVFSLLLGACATPTAYQSADNGYGFADKQIDETHYRVEFRGNTLTDRQVVETYLLYRAAEVTLESGHDYFIVLDQDVDKKTHYTSTYDYPYGGPFPYRYYPYHWHYNMAYHQPVRTSEKFTAVAEIHVGKGPKPAGEPAAYDARSVIEHLKDDIVLPEEQ
ncbi:MAG: hypothetical protein EP347_08155 [Alphaproteobacteria bacterium]|nr:MAG: hypothetical protein EP347_08155 [Alphaproteobacteria bacterium]